MDKPLIARTISYPEIGRDYEYKSNKRKYIRLIIGMLLMATGALCTLSNQVLISFVGVFFVVTGVQVCLWACGIRSEFLATNHVDSEELSDRPLEAIMLKTVSDLGASTHELQVLFREYSTGRDATEEKAKRVDEIVGNIIKMVNEVAPPLAIIFISNQVKSILGRSLSHSTMPTGEGDKLNYLMRISYSAIINISYWIIQEGASISQNDFMAVVDSSITLIRIAVDVNDSEYVYSNSYRRR